MENPIIFEALQELKADITALKELFLVKPQSGNSIRIEDIENRLAGFYKLLKDGSGTHHNELATQIKTISAEVKELRKEGNNSRSREQNNQQRLLDKIDNIQHTPQRKIITLDPKSWRFIRVTLLNILIIAGLIIYAYHLHCKNNELSDNDLKYRYIRMKDIGGSTFHFELDKFFRNKDNHKHIKELRRDVIEYEETIRQKVVAEEQARLQRLESERLDGEIDSLRNRK